MRLRITIEGISYDVDVEVIEQDRLTPPAPAHAAAPPAPSAVPAAPSPTIAPRPVPHVQVHDGGGVTSVKAPIAGNVTQVRVHVGDRVETNQAVVVMEAMKMETNIASPKSGQVTAIHCKAGDAVKPGDLLIELA